MLRRSPRKHGGGQAEQKSPEKRPPGESKSQSPGRATGHSSSGSKLNSVKKKLKETVEFQSGHAESSPEEECLIGVRQTRNSRKSTVEQVQKENVQTASVRRSPRKCISKPVLETCSDKKPSKQQNKSEPRQKGCSEVTGRSRTRARAEIPTGNPQVTVSKPGITKDQQLSFENRGRKRSQTAAGDKSRTAAGDKSRTAAGDKSRTATGDKSQTTAGDKSRTAAGDKSQTTAGDKSQTTAGDKSRTAAGDKSRTAAGDKSQSALAKKGSSKTSFHAEMGAKQTKITDFCGLKRKKKYDLEDANDLENMEKGGQGSSAVNTRAVKSKEEIPKKKGQKRGAHDVTSVTADCKKSRITNDPAVDSSRGPEEVSGVAVTETQTVMESGVTDVTMESADEVPAVLSKVLEENENPDVGDVMETNRTMSHQDQITKSEVEMAKETTEDLNEVDQGRPEELVNVIPQEVVPATPQEVVPDTPQEVVPETPQEVVPETPQEVVPETPQEVVPETPQEVVPETPQEVVTETPQEVVPETPQKVVPDTPREVVPDNPQEAVPETPRELVPETPQEVVPQEVVPETPQAVVPETPQEEVPKTPQEVVPEPMDVDGEVEDMDQDIHVPGPSGQVADPDIGIFDNDMEMEVEPASMATGVADSSENLTNTASEGQGTLHNQEPTGITPELDESAGQDVMRKDRAAVSDGPEKVSELVQQTDPTDSQQTESYSIQDFQSDDTDEAEGTGGNKQDWFPESDTDEDLDLDSDSQEAEMWRSEVSQKKWSQPSKPRLRSKWSDVDTEEYRNGYPGKKDNPNMRQNLLFYTNKLGSKPDSCRIAEFHDDWWGDYQRLERQHGYIQWLFPIREKGMNFQSQELQLHEAQGIKSDAAAKKRVLRSYEMMLDFYGIRLVDPHHGKLERAKNWQERFAHLNTSFHNYLRITRILKSLGELGYEYLKAPFVKFILREAFVEGTLTNCRKSCADYWVHTLRNEEERIQIAEKAEHYMEKYGTAARKSYLY